MTRASMRILELFVSLFCIASCQKAAGFVVMPIARHPTTMTGRSLPLFTKPRSVPLQILTAGSAGNSNDEHLTLRDRLRQVTGFSFTAFRATLRGITGISLTALYASAVATTSSFVRNTMKVILSVFPTWFRYFLQPFLVLYYVPLFVIRGTLGPAVKEGRAHHEHLVESWKSAVQAAEEAQHGGYWPVHVNEDGKIVAVRPPDPADDSNVDIVDAVAESMEVSMNEEDGTDESK